MRRLFALATSALTVLAAMALPSAATANAREDPGRDQLITHAENVTTSTTAAGALPTGLVLANSPGAVYRIDPGRHPPRNAEYVVNSSTSISPATDSLARTSLGLIGDRPADGTLPLDMYTMNVANGEALT